MELGNIYGAGSMWMVRKSEETEKAKQKRLRRKGTSKRMPLIGVVFERLLLRSVEVNMTGFEAKHANL